MKRREFNRIMKLTKQQEKVLERMRELREKNSEIYKKMGEVG